MRLETIKIYQFDELSEEAKERVIEKVRERIFDSDIILEDMKWAFLSILEGYGIEKEENEIGWDINKYGRFFVSFKLDDIDCSKLLKKKFSDEVLDNFSLSCEVRYNRIYIDVEFIGDVDEDDISEEIAEALREQIEGELYFIVEKIIEKIREALRNAYEYFFEDEDVIEYIEANEFEFYGDGTIA